MRVEVTRGNPLTQAWQQVSSPGEPSYFHLGTLLSIKSSGSQEPVLPRRMGQTSEQELGEDGFLHLLSAPRILKGLIGPAQALRSFDRVTLQRPLLLVLRPQGSQKRPLKSRGKDSWEPGSLLHWDSTFI